jgi:hypothetical protein
VVKALFLEAAPGNRARGMLLKLRVPLDANGVSQV